MNFDIYRAALFNRRIVIEQQDVTQDTFGQVQFDVNSSDGTWETFIECWANISPTSGLVTERAGREVSETWVAITVRYGSGKALLQKTPKMRVRDKTSGELYDIRSPMHMDGGRTMIQLTCLKIQ